ncbi:FecR family protein [Longitalea arenae]|uniref:FecR family protein n=1 Tax=Longitalea arenae TaxID=2812558 RepID=UPI0019676D8C|nr:FecR domain-containing protein [Longitalea arenae]
MVNLYAKYYQYTISDFLLDEDFLLWIRQPDEARDNFWHTLVTTYPHLADNIAGARKLAAALQVQKTQAPNATKQRIWNAVTASVAPSAKLRRMKRAAWWMAAAAVLLIAGGLTVFQFLRSNEVLIRTAYGEKRTLTLPDGSQVVLNANSQIKYKPRPKKNAPREVWVTGEAWFNVVHKNKTGTPVVAADRFLVHLQNMQVEVLGTTFTINTRRNQEQVVLQTGKVKVQLKTRPAPIYLLPGDLIRFNKDSQTLSKAITNPADCSLWKENRLKFDNTPLSEVIKLIEDNYGYSVQVTDSSLLSRTLGGTLSSNDQQILFKALENMLDVRITKTDQTITISK